METDRLPVLLDTDIGTDVDDVVALGLLLRAPEIDLRAVTTVYVDSALRARMAAAVLAVAGRSGTRVGVGVDRPLLGRDPLFWEGWEGVGIPGADVAPSDPPAHAVDLLIETVMAHSGEITVLAIGPLTNIALALLREPRLAGAVRRIVIMGGIVQRRSDQLDFPYVEHNIRCDPEAAQIVLASGAPITLVPLDVTTQVRIHRRDLANIGSGDRLGALVADQLERYMTHKGRDWINPHDALTAAALIRPDFLRAAPMRIGVETRGELTRAQTVAVRAPGRGAEPSTIEVALEVDAEAFEPWLIEMLAGPAVASGLRHAREEGRR